MSDFRLYSTAGSVPPSLARARPAERGMFRVGAVQSAWHPDPDQHRAVLADGVALAVREGAQLVCLQELTLSRYFAVDPRGAAEAGVEPEPLPGGPTHQFAVALATELGVHVHASLYEQAEPAHPEDPSPKLAAKAADSAGFAANLEVGAGGPAGFNTAICVAPDGTLVARTRKLHLPVTEGYFEDRYFLPGDTGFPVSTIAGAHVGFPTCWDQWFPELSRAYSLAGADLIVYPTAIGSEPDHPTFDTQPLWQQVIVGQGIASGTFMVAVNRVGGEAPLVFYGSSFISDPYGRVLVQAGRDEHAVLVADLDLDARRDWLELFPFLNTRRPDAYGPLVDP